MLLTVEQAKTKWCPFVRVHVPSGLINRVSSTWKALMAKPGASEGDKQWIADQEQDTHCIGDACMAWRHWGALGLSVSGFCGLAGHPQVKP